MLCLLMTVNFYIYLWNFISESYHTNTLHLVPSPSSNCTIVLYKFKIYCNLASDLCMMTQAFVEFEDVTSSDTVPSLTSVERFSGNFLIHIIKCSALHCIVGLLGESSVHVQNTIFTLLMATTVSEVYSQLLRLQSPLRQIFGFWYWAKQNLTWTCHPVRNGIFVVLV